ncbi:Rof/RNase P-like protein [Schizophyllum amplum]|uniref:Rof/RNase P-like protein n=1 Tax=Schizophyllum amplum TaxID=97359 RepID=A0A550CJR0_9AGAR|nr:Rof/RNase P-like protein [Auriculariopsis ampla]
MASSSAWSTLDVYKELPVIKGQKLKINSKTPYIPSYVKSNLELGPGNQDSIYSERIYGRNLMLENPARSSRLTKERKEREAKKRALREKKTAIGNAMSRKESRGMGLWELTDEQAKFDLFLPLHHLWMGYMSELMELSQPNTGKPPENCMPGSAGMHVKLVKADLHGSILTVKQSKNPALVGLSGITILETENTFRVVTRKNKVKLIPKENTIFSLALPLFSTLPSTHTTDTALTIPAETEGPPKTVLDSPYIEFELYGNQFRFRSADRATRKFKNKMTIEL